MAAGVLTQLTSLGIDAFVVSSTGNSSSALANAITAFDGIVMHQFAGKDFASRHQHHENAQTQLHIIDGNYVAASAAAKAFARERGILFEGGFFNPARRESLKLAYLEALDEMEREPDVVVQAVSSGMGLYGGYRGMREYVQLGRLSKMPRLVCVQQDTCSPMVNAFCERSSTIKAHHIVENPHGLAEAILRSDPSEAYPHIFRTVTETGGTFCSVSAREIMFSWPALKAHEAIDADFAAAAALAGAMKLGQSGWIGKEESVLVNLTGG